MDYILNSFPISNEEYNELDKKFGDLAHYAAWQLVQKNIKNNHTDDQEDIAQEIRFAIIKAGSYYKRQVYLENCMRVARQHIKDSVVLKVLDRLEYLWRNRTKHGANKQKFGSYQEMVLDDIIKKHVPAKDQPKKDAPLKMETRFFTYTKAILWNITKSIGKKISRDKQIRNGLVSLSEYSYFAEQ